MFESHSPAEAPRGGVACALAAHGYVAADADEMKSLRQSVGAFRGKLIPANQLKNLDDQTVVALAAVLRAVANPNLTDIVFDDWSVLAAPRFLGRRYMAEQFNKFEAEGAWGISPHCIPHRCLHSISGAISQQLGMRGPNFGCGGGPGGDAEAFLSAAALLECEKVPGCWLVLSGGSPEQLPAASAQADSWRLHALALALAPATFAPAHSRLCLTPTRPRATSVQTCAAELLLLELHSVLTDDADEATAFTLGSGAPWLVVEPGKRRASVHRRAA